MPEIFVIFKAGLNAVVQILPVEGFSMKSNAPACTPART
jgi:hypothetical protein